MMRLATGVGIALWLSGCVLGPRHETPVIELPQEWPQDLSRSEAIRSDWQLWWTQFNDPVLDALVARAVSENLDLQQQAARVRAARARLGFAEAERMPTLGMQGEALRERQPAAAFPVAGAQSTTRNLFSLSALLDYEIDLWGRLAREREAAAARFEENLLAHDALRLTVITDVVTTYFDLRTAQRQLRIIDATLEAREASVRLEGLRHEAGEVNELVLLQARAELETLRAERPLIVEDLRRIGGALGELTGASAAELLSDVKLPDGRLADIEVGDPRPEFLPSELLERRPDIRAAEASLAAANAAIGISEAQRLPRINLGALFGTAASSGSELFTGDAERWQLGASVMGPLLDFGRSRATVEEAEALRDASALQYQATVNIAFREVRDALAMHARARERVTALRRQMEVLQRALKLAQIRHEEGLTGFIEVLDAQRALLDAERGLSLALRDRLVSTATLFKALGGGWQAAPGFDQATLP